jgi:hypothetical protein
VGFGRDREEAERNALGSLTAIFGRTVSGETRASYRYAEAVSEGLLEENREMESAVKTSFAMDSLIGAEIRDYWFDGLDTHYASALMDRLKCGILYNDLIESNQRIIEGLVALPRDRLNTLEAYSRYALAADIADANAVFINVLSVLSPASAAAGRALQPRGEEFRLAQVETARNIVIDVAVDQDRDGRVRAAVAAAFAAAGFGTGSGGPYRMELSLLLSPVDLPGTSNQVVRYTVSGKLLETATGREIFPFTISGREGHLSQSEAENRALRVIEQKIRDDFGGEFTAYLAGLSAAGG